MGASPYDIRVTILMRPMIMAINLGLCYPGFPVAALPSTAWRHALTL